MKRVSVLIITTLLVFCFAAFVLVYSLRSISSSSQPQILIDYVLEGGAFELPVSGSTGYAAVELPVYRTASENANIIFTLNEGRAFTILREENDWWQIEIHNFGSNTTGWVMHKYCFINLPDIIPSIVYDTTNTYFSLFRSSGLEIPNITGRPLYDGRDFNARLERDEFISLVLYAIAPKIFAAQQAALVDGNTLVMYEAFRPAEAHDTLHEHFSHLINTNPLVRAGITAHNFNIRWFLAEAPYNHQRGTAMDVSLARINSWERRSTGPYAYIHITDHTEYPMQTPIHELSVAAAVFDSTVHARSTTSWIGAEISERATLGTILLQRYCTDAGLIPLASEWWHFNDLVNTAEAIEMEIEGRFELTGTYSRPPPGPGRSLRR
ncbi:MAG: SH3 domain-containing protein [Treponema sp.]|nr:SH3 domain-containing protein [Treponema sp.]